MIRISMIFNFKIAEANAREASLDKFMVPFVEKLPDWDRVHSFQFQDGKQVYEVALDNPVAVIPRPMKEALGGEGLDANVIQSLLFVEVSGGYQVLLARYYPASNEDVRNFEELSYDRLAEGWNGVVDVYSFGEEHIMNFVVSEGITVMSRTYSPAVPSEGALMAPSCFSFWVDFATYGIRGGVGSSPSQYLTLCNPSPSGCPSSLAVTFPLTVCCA